MTAVSDSLAFASASQLLPETVRADTLRHLRDTIGCGFAGSTAPGAAELRAAAQGWGAGDTARILGLTERAPAAIAACLNGFHIHCLEWDAVHEPAVVHALSVTTAALLASADRTAGVSREDFLTALAIGVDIASGLGIAATSGLRFFRPANAGLMGAALAVARLEGMTAAQMHDVFGLAYSQVAGTMQAHTEGSIALPLQVALAARSAITAVDMVRAGLTGPHDVLEGPFGYFRLIEAEADLSRYLGRLGRDWLISEVSTKPFPTGRASHGVLSTLQKLQRDHGFAAGDVARIEADLPPLAFRLVGRPMRADMAPGYARLCVQFLAALMLTDGIIDPRRFTPQTFADPDLTDLAGRIERREDGNPDPNALVPQHLVVRLRDGRVLDAAVPHVLGSPQWPMSAADYAGKRAACFALAAQAPDAAILQQIEDDPAGFAIGVRPGD